MPEEGDIQVPQNKCFYRCCRTKPCSTVICINCGLPYHKSCSDRYKIKAVDECRVICCDNNRSKEDDHSIKNEDTILSIKRENQLLQSLYWQSEDKNNVLKDNNALLLDKIDYLNKRVQELEHQIQLLHTENETVQTYSTVKMGVPNQRGTGQNLLKATEKKLHEYINLSNENVGDVARKILLKKE